MDSMGIMPDKRSPSKYFMERLAFLRPLWARLGLSDDQAYVPSIKSQQETARRHKRVCILREFSHEEFVCYTPGLFGTLLGFANSARVKDTQHRVDYFLKSFLQKLVPANVLNLLDWRTCTPQDACLCADSANGQPCPHVQDAIAGLDAVAPPQAQVLALLAALHLFAGICGACAAMFKRLGLALACALDKNIDAVAYAESALNADMKDASRSRKRRFDEDWKHGVIIEANREGRGTSEGFLRAVDVVAPAVAYVWGQQELLEYQSAGWMSGSLLEVVCCSLDGARIGNPAQNVEVAIACCFGHDDLEFSIWLPPVVFPQ
jgi:hypothetical protein